MPLFLPRSSFYRQTRDWRLDSRRATTTLLHQFVEAGPLTIMLFHATRLHYLPRAMHATYVAKDKGVVGRVNWQLLAHALKSFTGHYKSGPTTIGVTRRAGEPQTDMGLG